MVNEMVYLDPFIIAPILDYIEDNRGCTVTDLQAAFPHIDPKEMVRYMERMEPRGYIRKTTKTTKRRVRWEIVPACRSRKHGSSAIPDVME